MPSTSHRNDHEVTTYSEIARGLDRRTSWAALRSLIYPWASRGYSRFVNDRCEGNVAPAQSSPIGYK